MFVYTLSQVVRQEEKLLITAVNELAYGKPSAEIIAFINSLSGNLDIPPTDKRVLYSRNDYVTIHNKQELQRLPGESVTFNSDDTGPASQLAKMIVEKVSSLVHYNFLRYHQEVMSCFPVLRNVCFIT